MKEKAMVHHRRCCMIPLRMVAALALFLVAACSVQAQTASDSSFTEQPAVWQMADFNLEDNELWKEATRDWHLNQRKDCLRTAGIKINCDDCERVNVKASIAIDTEGKVIDIRKVSSASYCRQRTEAELQPVEDCLMESFRSIVFPPPFRGKLIEGSLDRGPRLGC
jgi:hypothetical protein